MLRCLHASLATLRPRATAYSVRGVAIARLGTWQQFQASAWSGHRAFSAGSVAQQPLAACITTTAVDAPAPNRGEAASLPTPKLPESCPGCGAPGQTLDPDAPGYYDVTRMVRTHQRAHKSIKRAQEDAVFKAALDSGALPDVPPNSRHGDQEKPTTTTEPLLCARCRNLLHQSRGTPVIHPSIENIQQMIEESPHEHNHIYHVLDAADFPLSLVPNLQRALKLPRLRTQNRRSKHARYLRGRTAEVSFVITRADLLAPQKEAVDAMMPYLREVLRDALSQRDRNVRLGNVRCVSAKRGWWTVALKEDIWRRGGAAWMVGKVNVGKSALFDVVFPKGRRQPDVHVEGERQKALGSLDRMTASVPNDTHAESHHTSLQLQHFPASAAEEELSWLAEETLLLPPPRPETPYPDMPLVSSLPGTTASPIRIPFGDGKGELIDLPGIHRSSLDEHVKTEYRKDLVMTHRITPEQYTVKPGQSLLLGGGVVRVVPKSDSLITLAYPFLPTSLKAHVTSNTKAVAIQTGVYPEVTASNMGDLQAGDEYKGTVTSTLTPTARQEVKSAGTFKLRWDVTRRRTGSLTDRAAGKRKVAELPFIVYSADLLVEGCGWVELICQVRRRSESSLSPPPQVVPAAVDALSSLEAASEAESKRTSQGRGGPEGLGIQSPPLGGRKIAFPEVEVFTPQGKFVAIRPPMNAWLVGGPKKLPKHKRRARPRQTISRVKRRLAGQRAKAALAAVKQD